MQKHSIIELGKVLWRSPTPLTLLKAGSATAGYLGPCPVGFWVYPRRETTTSLSNLFQCLITLTVQKPSLMFKWNNHHEQYKPCTRGAKPVFTFILQYMIQAWVKPEHMNILVLQYLVHDFLSFTVHIDNNFLMKSKQCIKKKKH